MSSFYLGGPINGCTDEEAHGWRDAAKEILMRGGHTWRDPMERDYRGQEQDLGIVKEIVEGDKDDIDLCDVALMNCPKPSYGTAMEILYAWEHGNIVLVVLPDDGSTPSPWITYHSDHIFRGSVVDALSAVAADSSFLQDV
jgi:hypothetical protein